MLRIQDWSIVLEGVLNMVNVCGQNLEHEGLKGGSKAHLKKGHVEERRNLSNV